MIKIEKCNICGWEQAIRGMRNPMNSWDNSCSVYQPWGVDLCEADLNLMRNLCSAGPDHRKFMRMITVYVDITAPLYWWKEFDTYKVGTVANSCSTMHKIQQKEFTLDDFSHEHLMDCGVHVLQTTICYLNAARNSYNKNKDKKFWWQMIQLLPSSYNQKRTVMLNYEVLSNIYKSRKAHKLDEWLELCAWIRALPYAQLITQEWGDESDNGN